jgi:hypothetical protein
MQTDSVWKVFSVDVRHMPYVDLEVYGTITEGGGYDDEPLWRDVEITDIWSLDKHAPVSEKIKTYLLKEYGEYFGQELLDEYERW